MKVKSEIIWAILLIGSATLAFYLGSRTERIEMEDDVLSIVKEKSDTIRALKIKIGQLSEELTSRGIYSYPQAHIVKEDDSSSVVLITLNGKETIPDLEIEKMITYENGENDKVNERKELTTNIGNLTPHNPVAFEIKEFKKSIKIILEFKSGKKQWHQCIIAKKTSQGEIKTFWVLTTEDSMVIDKHVDQGFPTDDEGYLVMGPNKKMKFAEIEFQSIFHR
ncbi:hypothetical protein [Salinimicrobium sp. TH3]|uniref:hypothetical protein n=1 Tax=Salinimicrobium sp. TH3 TaxID=2997342 RepID=UPI0022733670|nr:hypothetical protein [Salinimicrobium sp. TH3]MCY2685936.1 hypothetical protein [Salinimicrobium sp. TH3]